MFRPVVDPDGRNILSLLILLQFYNWENGFESKCLSWFLSSSSNTNIYALEVFQVISSSKSCKTNDPIGFFTNFPQYKNANIANFVLAVTSERNWTNEVCNLEM